MVRKLLKDIFTISLLGLMGYVFNFLFSYLFQTSLYELVMGCILLTILILTFTYIKLSSRGSQLIVLDRSISRSFSDSLFTFFLCFAVVVGIKYFSDGGLYSPMPRVLYDLKTLLWFITLSVFVIPLLEEIFFKKVLFEYLLFSNDNHKKLVLSSLFTVLHKFPSYLSIYFFIFQYITLSLYSKNASIVQTFLIHSMLNLCMMILMWKDQLMLFID